MKKMWVGVLVFCCCLLSACGANRHVSGMIIETTVDEEGGMTSFVIQTDEDKEIGILVTDKTRMFSFVDGMSAEDFEEGASANVIVSVDYDASYRATQIEVTGYRTEDVVALSDGTSVNVWQYLNAVAYTLPNGTELLRVQNPTGPNRVSVGGIESFDDLGEAAQNRVLSFYLSQEVLYDVQVELEKAYDGYLRTEKPLEFDPFMLSQDTLPAASNETVMYFLTTVSFPTDGSHNYEYRIGAAFDRATGEHMDNLDLFSCPPDEVMQNILDIAGIDDSLLRAEMEGAFHPEYLIFFTDYLEVCFPQGTLPSQEHTFMLTLDYEERLTEMLYQWAIPAGGN